MANPIESKKVVRNHFVARFNGKTTTKLHVLVGVVVGGASELLMRTFFGAIKSKFL